jgi:monothiol glutaredoxin
MALDSETRGKIENLLSSNKVVLFMKGTPAQPQCGFSATTISTLDMMVSDYATVNVLENPAIREGIKEFGNWPTVPQLYVDGELIGGSDIVTEMLQSGELADVLGVTPPDVAETSISIDAAGIDVMKQALASNAGNVLQLQVSASWTHTISLGPDKGLAISVPVNDIELHMDPWSAARANGLSMTWEESMTGTRFAFDNPNAPPLVNQMTVQTLKEKLDGNDPVILIDVRSDEERADASIEGSRQWNEETRTELENLPKDTELVFHCAGGGRSQSLADAFRQQGFTDLHNVKGGIQAWLAEIES